MTEQEKAQAGQLYDANYDPSLIAQRMACDELCYAYNQLRPGQEQEREALLRRLFGKTAGTFTVMQPFWCDYGYNIEIGSRFYLNRGAVILDAAPVRFGDDVFIGPCCGFYTAGHPLDIEQRNQGLELAYPILVGSNVWIGGHTCVLPGAAIGDGTVIGAGSVVTRSIPAGVLAAGSPCRVIRPLTEADKAKYGVYMP